jgi:hypothetical protein
MQPRAYYGLSIDTRRELGLLPRLLKSPDTVRMLERLVQHRTTEDQHVFEEELVEVEWKNESVNGVVHGVPFDNVCISMSFNIMSDGLIWYDVGKTWRNEEDNVVASQMTHYTAEGIVTCRGPVCLSSDSRPAPPQGTRQVPT